MQQDWYSQRFVAVPWYVSWGTRWGGVYCAPVLPINLTSGGANFFAHDDVAHVDVNGNGFHDQIHRHYQPMAVLDLDQDPATPAMEPLLIRTL